MLIGRFRGGEPWESVEIVVKRNEQRDVYVVY